MSVIGVLGGGQLVRMLALAGVPLGMRFVFLDPKHDACAASLGEFLCGDYDDCEKLAHLAELADVVTYEFENVPEKSIECIVGRVPVFPGAVSLSACRDRLREKKLFKKAGIPTTVFEPVASLEDLKNAAAKIGLPAVLKTRTLGYDGKGQAVLRGPDDITAAWARLGGVPLILEKFAAFQREVSMICVRGLKGEIVFYPLTENVHKDGILHFSRIRPGDGFEAKAREYAGRLLEELAHVGVLVLELFCVGEELLANEIAPRVHNSGHWTINGAETSQFENHIRAILDLPLGGTGAKGSVAMVNFVGRLPEMGKVLAVPGAKLHIYGKEPRPCRKLGHATVVAGTEKELDAALEMLLALGKE